MNFPTYKLCLNLIKSSKINQFVNISKNHVSPSLKESSVVSIRTVLTRPKEFDELRRQSKKHVKDDEYEGKLGATEKIGAYGYFLLSIPVISFGLGIWQIRRRIWKLNLIKDLENSLSREPIELPENLEDLSNLNYCPIKVRGEFLYDKEFLVGPKALITDGRIESEGKSNLLSLGSLNRGYNIITPFKIKDRDTVILVNRGWIPKKYKNENERKKLQKEGIVELVGINRLTEARPQFVPKNQPEKGMWHYRNIDEMAKFANTHPILLERLKSDSDAKEPIGSQTRINLRNDHVSYIITWFGLSGFTGYFWFRQFIQKIPLF